LYRRRLLACSTAGLLLFSTLISTLHIVGSYVYYRAPMEIYAYLTNVEAPKHLAVQQTQQPSTTFARVCTGEAWHHFPSSYFLPKHTRLYFLPSTDDHPIPEYVEWLNQSPEAIPDATDQPKLHTLGQWFTVWSNTTSTFQDKYVSDLSQDQGTKQKRYSTYSLTYH
jgi:hypothetical protein